MTLRIADCGLRIGAATIALTLGVRAQQPATPVFTAEQAAAGRAAYQANCASCHLPDLSGRNEAPQLAGNNFMSTWRTRTTKDLFDYVQTMPPNAPSLDAAQYLAITTFLLQANGAAPGSQPFTPVTAVAIGSVASGVVNTAAAAGGGRAGAQRGAASGAPPPGAAGRGAANAGPLGLTATGEVKNFVPVTDEMLRNQDPGDWLMARRNYQGWSSTPLTQVTRDNVKDLQLAWVWAMNEGAANEPTPIVHNGVMYLTNTMNVSRRWTREPAS